MNRQVKIIAAMTPNRVIGIGNKLPWDNPQDGFDSIKLQGDLPRFEKLTTRNIVVMGRNTFFSIPEKFRPLKNRKNIVITSKASEEFPEQVLTSTSLQESIQKFLAGEYDPYFEDKLPDKVLWLIGGAQIYDQGLTSGQVSEMILTEINQEFSEADYAENVKFPEFDKTLWHKKIIAQTNQYSVARYFRE